MHRLAATPGGWSPDAEGVIFVDQTPAPIVVLTAADTDIQAIARAIIQLPTNAPAVRVVNLLQLQQQLSIDTYADDVLRHAQCIVVRLLGGRAYWSYGLEVVKQTAQDHNIALFIIPGDDRPDLDLMSHSTVPLSAVNTLWRYFTEGGIENSTHALQFLANTALGTSFPTPSPQAVPRVGQYSWTPDLLSDLLTLDSQLLPPNASPPSIGLLFYRAHYLSGNTAPIDALCEAIAQQGGQPRPIFVSSLRDPEVQAEVLDLLRPAHASPVQVLLNTTSFSVAQLNDATLNLDLWKALDVPVIQAILSGGTQEQWQQQWRGLSPRDLAMNVALPEVDGRIISRAVSFKSVQNRNDALETDVVAYEPVGDRIQFVSALAMNWARLAQTPVAERRIALILANYPNRDGRLANGVGLDTPASCIEILRALQAAGYTVSDIPADGDALIRALTQGVTNDPEAADLRTVRQSLDLADYEKFFATLPDSVQKEIGDRWGQPQPHHAEGSATAFPIAGLQLGNIFVGIQPSRGYDLDPSLNYHAPDLEPTYDYLAFYHWLRQHFGSQAIAHLGKHGNLEWLPGKSIALSDTCYPEVAFGPMPHLYPFIVNDPGEGAQAKRRAQAVIIDHLTPPLTRAELYGSLQKLEGLIDEYYEAQGLDPSRLDVIGDRIQALIQAEHLDTDLNLLPPQLLPQTPPSLPPLQDFIARADGYLCELKESQIRDGLHIFGQCPDGTQLRDLVVAIARHPAPGRPGLLRAIAQSWQIDPDWLTEDLATPLPPDLIPQIPVYPELPPYRTVGDLIEALEQEAAQLVETLLQLPTSSKLLSHPELTQQIPPANATLLVKGGRGDHSSIGRDSQTELRQSSPQSPIQNSKLKTPNSKLRTQNSELTWLQTHLIPVLRATPQEITHLLHGLSGGYVPSGSSGAPTRGRADVLPTGRNFYSVDIRAIPTESAWDVGRKAAEVLIERYCQENGDFPKTLGLSVWGTSTMRTGGDDIAEALALLGVQPVWDGASRRVIDFEILPLSLLNRPRVDVTLRVSGFFRDGFANLIDLFDRAVEAVANLDEPDDDNPLAAQVRQDADRWQAAGLSESQAVERSRYRVFGSKPGAYGAGLQGLIEAQNWTSDEDLARAYINWSSYAYTGRSDGRSAPEAFEQRLAQMQIVLHNQDNREHDILDSDDYYQFQGGLTAAVRSVQGRSPVTYFGDHSRPDNPRVRHLREEIARVYRSRVVNPKWIAGAMRHGYKGAFEMAATMDYLFAYDATTHCVEDFMYEGIAQAYVLDAAVQTFVQDKNPWALRDMAERLLEAHQRKLWPSADEKMLDQLRAIAHAAEADIEAHTDPTPFKA
ncbi:MAG: cobaltochelatase subunit CobN [Elainellaceae cyanobacterium]